MLDNVKHEKFARLVADGMCQGRAYEQAGFKSRGDAADQGGSKLVRTPKVSHRIKEIREKSAEKSDITKEELLSFLAEVVRTPAGEVDRDNRLCQSVKDGPDFHEIRMPDKLRAVDQVCRMFGWTKEKLQLEVSGKFELEFEVDERE
jgi:hypothetical protein